MRNPRRDKFACLALRRGLAGAALLGSLFLSTAARAQEACPRGADGPVPGTVGAGLLTGAIDKNARIYGAAKLAERQLLPLMAVNEGLIVRYEVGAIPGVLRIPVCDGEGGVKTGTIDLSGGGFAFGWRRGGLSLYAVGSGASHIVGGPGNERVGMAFLGIAAAQGSPIAFYRRRFAKEDGSLSVNFDAIVGGQWVTEYGSASLGYAASQGIFGNLDLAPIKAFVSGVVSTAQQQAQDSVDRARNSAERSLLDAIPYARTGFTTLDWLTGAPEMLGTSSLYLRRLQYSSVPRGTNSFAREAPSVAETSLTTYHLEQYAVFRHLDMSVALATSPRTFLQEASLGFRYGNPMSTDMAMAKIRDGADASEMNGVRALVGVVKVPSLWYYGLEGGYRVHVSVEASLAANSDGKDFFHIRLGVNTPEVLSVYPYASNAGDIYFGGAYTF